MTQYTVFRYHSSCCPATAGMTHGDQLRPSRSATTTSSVRALVWMAPVNFMGRSALVRWKILATAGQRMSKYPMVQRFCEKIRFPAKRVRSDLLRSILACKFSWHFLAEDGW